MISDPTDPVIAAENALYAAQRPYDEALTAGVGLSLLDRRKLAAPLALARMEMRIAIFGSPICDETRLLTHMLPALEPVREDEE